MICMQMKTYELIEKKKACLNYTKWKKNQNTELTQFQCESEKCIWVFFCWCVRRLVSFQNFLSLQSLILLFIEHQTYPIWPFSMLKQRRQNNFLKTIIKFSGPRARSRARFTQQKLTWQLKMLRCTVTVQPSIRKLCSFDSQTNETWCRLPLPYLYLLLIYYFVKKMVILRKKTW